MYRPTVRYDEVFKNYVDQVFQITTLDRNQIIRLALFTVAHSKDFHEVLKDYQIKEDVPTPSPSWEPWEYGYWLNQSFQKREGRGDVSVKPGRTKETETIASAARITEQTKLINVLERMRDEKGRFLPNKELEYVDKEELKLRSIKVVHVKGTYGTYLIKNKWLSEIGRNVLISIALIVALTVLF